MEYKPLPVGVENFEKLINWGCYYVDKTLFIKELIDKKGEINLFTRPRRFGKTLTLSMVQHFFEKCEKDRSGLFDGLKIMTAGDRYTSEMGKYPVINITLKDVEQRDFESSFWMLRTELEREFDRHRYLLESEKISDYNKELYVSILSRKADDKTYTSSLRFLSECLEQHYGEKVVILIDEYDVPIQKAYFNGYYDEMVDVIRTLFHTALKTNRSLGFAVITGCLRVSKESIFTGFNNPKMISITSDMYGEYFGFTDEEVVAQLGFYGLEHKVDEARRWYNGYVFGNATVYNPWSIINYVSDAYENKNWFPVSYWANTSSNSIIRELVEIADGDTRDEIEALIRGESLTKPIHEDVVYGEIRQNMDNLWNFLFFTGYLKKTGEQSDGETRYYDLEIPNIEVLTIFKRKIREWFQDRVRTTDLDRMYAAILDSDAGTFEKELSSLLSDTISYFDSQESFYHGFLTGALSRMHNCKVRSNRESGNGRGDIFVLPVSMKKTAVIIEVKVAGKYTGMEEKCLEALAQIEEKKCGYDLSQEGYADIRKYGIAFYRKDCMVRNSI